MAGMPSLIRRVLSSGIDLPLVLLVPMIFWHWGEWMRQTATFFRIWPDAAAFAIMSTLPITVLWIEGITGRGFGKFVAGLRVALPDGTPPTVARSFARAILKWSPIWIGPAGRLIETAFGTNYTGLFGQDITFAQRDLTESMGKGVSGLSGVWNVAALGMSFGIYAVAVLAAGQLLVLLPDRRSLLDRLTGTVVLRGQPSPADAPPAVMPAAA
jgi:uncharacterized RDD family membrane protein YckC